MTSLLILALNNLDAAELAERADVLASLIEDELVIVCYDANDAFATVKICAGVLPAPTLPMLAPALA